MLHVPGMMMFVTTFQTTQLDCAVQLPWVREAASMQGKSFDTWTVSWDMLTIKQSLSRFKMTVALAFLDLIGL